MKKVIFIGATLMTVIIIIIFFILFFVPVSQVRVGYGGTQPERVRLAAMDRLKSGPLVVYYYAEHKGITTEVIKMMEQTWQLVQKRMNVDLGRFRVAVVVPRGERPNWDGAIIEINGFETILMLLGVQTPIFPLWLPYPVASLEELSSSELFFFYWAMPHEAAEHSLVKRVYHDRKARWIGDGLAEYIAYMVSGALAVRVQRHALKSRQSEIQNLLMLEANRNRYDLVQEFLYGTNLKEEIEIVGYGVSLAFWLQIAQQHGEGVIKEFWQRFSQKGFPNAQEAARILSELTGEDIWTKLQNMDLHEVLQTLERAAGD